MRIFTATKLTPSMNRRKKDAKSPSSAATVIVNMANCIHTKVSSNSRYTKRMFQHRIQLIATKYVNSFDSRPSAYSKNCFDCRKTRPSMFILESFIFSCKLAIL